MGANVDLWRAILGMGMPRPETPLNPEDVSDPRYNYKLKGAHFGDIADAVRSLRYGEDSVQRPMGNPNDIALPQRPGLGQPPPGIEQAIAARGPMLPQSDPNGIEAVTAFPPAPQGPVLRDPRGQVQVTINGKTYDYAKDERIDDALKGRMGAGSMQIGSPNLNATGYQSFGGQGGRGSASIVGLSDDSTTPMEDQMRAEQLARTQAAAAQGQANLDVADPYGAQAERRTAIETAALGQRGQTGIEQKVAGERARADVIAQQEIQEHAQIDQDANRELAQTLNTLHQLPAFQDGGLQQRMDMERKVRESMAQHTDQQKREASIALYSRFGIVKSPTLGRKDEGTLP